MGQLFGTKTGVGGNQISKLYYDRMKLILTFLVICLGVYKVAYACSCVSVGSVKENYKYSDLIFKGTPIKREIVLIDSENRERIVPENWMPLIYPKGKIMARYTVNSIEYFKGALKTRMVYIYTGLGGGDCGVYFKIGDIYVIYADNSNEKNKSKAMFGTSICSRTTRDHVRESSELRKLLAVRHVP